MNFLKTEKTERTSVFGPVRTTCSEFCWPHGQNPSCGGQKLSIIKKKHLQEVLEEFSKRYTEGKDPA